MGTDSNDKNPKQGQRVPMDRRSGLERRSDIERRLQKLEPPDGKERRGGMHRRGGLDRRSGIDRRLNIQDLPGHSVQSMDEYSPTMESKGLFSCVISLIKRWVS